MPEDLPLIRDFAIIMAVAGGALVLFRRLGQPPILGYLLAGLITGPFILPSFSIQDTQTIRLLADLGLVLLLFALGLEFGWERLRRIGLRVVLIGAIEMTFMVALGYEIGILLGWSGREAIFLGAALSISSSAVLVKMLRDTGRLYKTQGRLIIGILVVEDFAAVIFLSILSGIATTGTTHLSDIWLLVGKLALFSLSALVFGQLLTPRLIRYVVRFRSQETLLLTGLALCFGLALVAHGVGISPAAGAFLIGTVLGDSEHAEEITRIMSPVRDMFAALVFVSIGMLVDPSLLARFLGPALVVSAVFIGGKVIANTVGTFFTGHDGKTSLSVGMGMPQMGEFSLAMVKVGADHGAVGAFLYPVVTVTTAMTAFVYPLLFRSVDATAAFLEQRSPRLLKQYIAYLEVWLIALRSTFGFRGKMAEQIQHSGRIILINLGILMVLFWVGTFVLQFTRQLADLLHLRQGVLGLVVGFAVIVLCLPSGVAVWRELQRLADELTQYLFRRHVASSRLWRSEDLRMLLWDSILVAVVILLAIWTIPFVSHLLLLGRFSVPLPILLLAAGVFLTARIAFKIHGILEATFSRTFLGQSDPEPEKDTDEKP